MGITRCSPDEVLVVSGCCHSRPAFHRSGVVFTWPGLQKVQRLPVNKLNLTIETEEVYSKERVPICVRGTAQVKVGDRNDALLEMASELFLNKTQEDIARVARETLEGHQRVAIGNTNVKEIRDDRKSFSKAVSESAACDLINFGILIVSYELKDLWDNGGYLKSLNAERVDEVKKMYGVEKTTGNS